MTSKPNIGTLAYVETVLDGLPHGVFTTDENGLVTSWNSEAERITGYDKSEMVGRECSIFVTEQDEQEHSIAPDCPHDPIQACECSVVRKDGGRLIISKNSEVLIGPDGNPIGRIENFTDISERKATADRCGRAENLFLAMIDNTERKRTQNMLLLQRDLALTLAGSSRLKDVVSTAVEMVMQATDMDGALIYLVEEASGDLVVQSYGGVSESCAMNVARFRADSDQTRLAMAGEPLFGNNGGFGFGASGPTCTESIVATAIIPMSHENKVVGCLSVCSHTLDEIPQDSKQAMIAIAAQVGNAVARSKAQQDLEKSKAFLRQTIEQAPFAILICEGDSSNWTMTTFNKEAEHILGASAKDLDSIRMDGGKILDRASITWKMRRGDGSPWGKRNDPLTSAMLHGRTTKNAELRVVRTDGTEIRVLCNAAPIMSPNGRQIGGIATAADITALKKAEESLVGHQRHLEELVNDRSARLLDASEEISREVGARTRAQTELQRSDERLRAVMSALPDIVFVIDEDGKYREMHTGNKHLLYKESKELLGRHLHEVFDKAVADSILDVIKRTANTGLSISMEYEHEVHGVRRYFDGRTTLMNVTLDGKRAVVLAARDITHRKVAENQIRQLNRSLEERVRTRTSQLETTNKELEAFAYSVSHDLRAPLRRIDGFCCAIMEDYGSKLGENGRMYLERLHSSSNKMSDLIDELLKLSRLTQEPLVVESIDLGSVAKQITDDLRLTEPGRRAEIIIAGGQTLIVDGDITLLRAALQNLFDNAWKFTSKKTNTRIEFGTTHEQDKRVFFVRDNGAGFDAAYSDKLFAPFQRLHAISEFRGTGIGLATVKRVIARHGGIVWAESDPGNGATFYFTIPQNKKLFD